MGRRRFTSLILLVALGAFVLIARLFTVQVAEHDVWTAQADALMRDGSVEPYTRGEILDCRGRVLARDVESYRINADYRDFRRGNALGIVAHARSTLEMRPVPLASARETLVPWALALGRLTPRDIEGFQRGEALAFEGFQIAAALPESDARFGRGVDLEFYATALFDLKASERSRLKKFEGKEPELAFVDRIARVRGISRDEAERALARRCELDLSYLDDLAQLWGQGQPGPEAPIARVLAELERWRADVEDGAAGDLFESAAGFPAGRLESACLEEFFDLDWIRRTMRWDEPRLQAWTRAARSDWLALRDGPLLDFAVERVRRDTSGLGLADLVLNEVSPLFVAQNRERGVASAAMATWCGSRSAVVLGELDKLFDFDLPGAIDEPPKLPFFDARFVEQAEAIPADAGVLAEAEFWRADGTTAEPGLLESAAASWRAMSAEVSVDRASLRRGFEALFLRFEDAFQAELRARLERIREYAELPGAKLPMAKAGLGRAEERARYILKDRGSRHFVAIARPSYPLVNLLTRYPEHLRGFEVERVHLRVNPTRDEQDRPIARLLVGGLSPPSVARRISQVETERRIAELEASGARDEATEAMLAELRAGLDRPDEEIGNSGLERWFEPELAGRNGFHESGGLADRETGARGRPVIDKVDGLDLTTTLDAALQAEAEYCLEHPEGDRNADSTDKTWLKDPTGAIVLLSPTGDVIVAASVPLVARPPAPGRKLVSDDVRERTLTKPDFQPPGSVFKPFVAAYALDRLGLDPRLIRDCSAASNPGGHGPGYGGVHCHETHAGHGSVDLARALTVSCNSYFAWLGEQYDSENLRSMAHEFGFGEPTGVRAFDNGVRSGLREDFVGNLFQGKELTGRSLCEAGNGLSVVEATPMQIARATAGLATGRLPQLRLVSRIGDAELPSEGRDLTISKSALDVVRNAMLAVAGTNEGSAHAALSESELGFAMAAKTGSADLTSFAVEENRVLKHTWVAGWFPAENPVGILVVFEHKTTRTSTHGAIWLARQFLRRPAVSAWIAEQTSSR